MQISLIVAMASNHAIGQNNQLPWHLSADLKRFKQLTMGSPIIMGRKTHESIGRPLPGRENIVISRTPHYVAPGCLVFQDCASALAHCHNYPEVFVIGGAQLYECLLPQAERIYLTAIHQYVVGDTFFPRLPPEEWQETERQTISDDASVDFDYSFITLTRRHHDQ
jgi:dihydrofolate reductase